MRGVFSSLGWVSYGLRYSESKVQTARNFRNTCGYSRVHICRLHWYSLLTHVLCTWSGGTWRKRAWNQPTAKCVRVKMFFSYCRREAWLPLTIPNALVPFQYTVPVNIQFQYTFAFWVYFLFMFNIALQDGKLQHETRNKGIVGPTMVPEALYYNHLWIWYAALLACADHWMIFCILNLLSFICWKHCLMNICRAEQEL